MSIYSKKVINHFQNPHNCGKIKNPDGIGKVGNIVCGDVMYLYIKIGKNKKKEEIIKNIKFETFGCVAAISTSSVVTDLVMGKTLDEAMKLEKNNVINSLEGLPPIKIHCSILAIDALSEAIYDYLSKNKRLIPEELAKKHERIDKERHSVEEKHKDWVEKEEKMFNK